MTALSRDGVTDRGKRGALYFMIKIGCGVWGLVFFVGINLLLYVRHPVDLRQLSIFVWLGVTFVGSEILGFLVGATMWYRMHRSAV